MKKRTLITLSCIMAAMLALTACGESKSAAVDSKSIKETVSTENVELETETVSDNAASAESESTQPVGTESIESTESETETEPQDQAALQNSTYTYTNAESVMYAKSSVNVRDLPSADGAKLGGLSQNQETTVTGTCNETGWYRIAYKDSVGYVSDKYLVSEQTAAPAPKSNAIASNNTPAAAPATPAPAEVKSNIVIPAPVVATSGGGAAAPSGSSIRDGFDLSTDEGMMAWLQAGHSSSEIINEAPGMPAVTCTHSIREDSYETGKKVLELINQDRASEGIPALIWNDDLYNIAMQRCLESNGHDGARAGTGENESCTIAPDCSAEDIFFGTSTSPSHRANYMNPNWTHAAVAASQRIGSDGFNDGDCYQVFQ